MKKTKWGHWLLTFTTVFALIIAIFPFGNVIRTHLENRFPVPVNLPVNIDGIIVLGGAVSPVLSDDRAQLTLQGNSERLFGFAKLAKKYPTAKLIYTGGSGSLSDQHLKEAHFAKLAFDEFEIPEGRIIYEDQSRNTIENALFSKKIAMPKLRENWILITSAQHMPRAIGSFRQAEWDVIAYPVDFSMKTDLSFPLTFNFARNSSSLSYSLHEVVGLFTYWLTGKTDSLYPSPLSQ